MFKDETVCGTLPMEALICTTDMSAIGFALKGIIQRREQNWPMRTDSERLVKAVKYLKSQHLLLNISSSRQTARALYKNNAMQSISSHRYSEKQKRRLAAKKQQNIVPGYQIQTIIFSI